MTQETIMSSTRPRPLLALKSLIALALLLPAGAVAAHDGSAGVAPHRQGPGQWHRAVFTEVHASYTGPLGTRSPRVETRAHTLVARLKARALRRALAAHRDPRKVATARPHRRLRRIERRRLRDRARRNLARRAEAASAELDIRTSGGPMILAESPDRPGRTKAGWPQQVVEVSSPPAAAEPSSVEVPFVVEIQDAGDLGSAAQDGDFESVEWAILERINHLRAEHGLSRVRYDARLQAAAIKHSAEMYEMDYFSHTSPVSAHAEFATRINREGVTDFGIAGENLVMGPDASDLARRFVDIWMESPGHRANILGSDFRFTGIGVYGLQDRVYATQLFTQRVD